LQISIPQKARNPTGYDRVWSFRANCYNDTNHPSTTIIPITSRLADNVAPLRYRVGARDQLKTDFEVMPEQVRSIDNRRILPEALTVLTVLELAEIEEYLVNFFDLFSPESSRGLSASAARQ